MHGMRYTRETMHARKFTQEVRKWNGMFMEHTPIPPFQLLRHHWYRSGHLRVYIKDLILSLKRGCDKVFQWPPMRLAGHCEGTDGGG